MVVFFLKISAGACQDIPEARMREIYEEVKTPYKYGLVLIPEKGRLLSFSDSLGWISARPATWQKYR